jgi:Domain of unknown function (DUF4338)
MEAYADEFAQFCRSLRDSLARTTDGESKTDAFERLRREASKYLSRPSLPALKHMFLSNLVLDLVAHGWSLELLGNQITLRARPASSESPTEAKEKTRARHLFERNAQLREPSVRDFIASMERRRLTARGWHSIYSVMCDGQDLARRIAAGASVETIVDPYLQLVTPDAVCAETGLRLNDIWRYFRHTWVNIYRSVPGRSLMVLVRDRGTKGHPVIGIAALGSSVVQQSVRDRWIGWDSQGAYSALLRLPNAKLKRWLVSQVRDHIAGIYKEDLEKEGVLISANLKYPTVGLLAQLRKLSATAIRLHRKFPQAAQHKRNSSGNHTDWRAMARTPLFRSKRCKQLAILLSIRQTFNDLGLHRLSGIEFRSALETSGFRQAVSQLTRIVKAEKVGIGMMDIIVCGSIAPYNVLLGGKLVCLLLCSPEVTQFYAKRYKDQVSVIASAMCGKKIRRDPALVLLCTTSLYASGSSQYNRVKVPAALVGGREGEFVAYEELGTSEGFGSFHFSKETLRLADALLGRSKNGRKVNSIFGEGVNPLMRKLREALELMELPSDTLLRHGDKRIIYGIPLAANFRSYLLGLEGKPRYLITQKNPPLGTRLLAQYWRERWFAKRSSSPAVLERVAANSLSYPVRHGAQVPLPDQSEASVFVLSAASGG